MRTAKEKHAKAASIADSFLGWEQGEMLDVLASLYCATASTIYECTTNKEVVYQALFQQLDDIKKEIRRGNHYYAKRQ